MSVGSRPEEIRGPHSADELPEAADDFLQVVLAEPAKAISEAFCRERANLGDLDPAILWQDAGWYPPAQRISRPLRLAGDRQGDDRTRAVVEQVLAQHKDRSRAPLLVSADGIKVSPANLASQYSGQARSPRSHSSERARSSTGSRRASSRSSE